MRIEHDMVGSARIDEGAYYGLQTLRAVENFNISGQKLHSRFIISIAMIKKACAQVNFDGRKLSADVYHAITCACDEIIEGKLHDQFITDAVQGGAGTSANMNANEVIANRAIELLGGTIGDYSIVHPNDHVNMSQSTNDVIPSAGKMTVLFLMEDTIAQLRLLAESLRKKEVEYDSILKMGRTQLQDAVPIRLGQEFAAYKTMVLRNIDRLEAVKEEMRSLNMGGTAIGTKINADAYYVENIVPAISKVCGLSLCQTEDLIDATQSIDAFVAVSSVLKNCALSLSKMCNDLRLLSTGPRTGIHEIYLPPRQNGSSIMPGKVNPVIPEVVSQVAFSIAGNDVTISMAAEAGQLELNAFEPIVFYKLFESITMLTVAVQTLRVNCIDGITVNKGRCENLVKRSVGVITALCPVIGYTLAADIAKTAIAKNISVKDELRARNILSEEEIEAYLDPYKMT